MEKPKIIIELKDLEKKKARLEELIMHYDRMSLSVPGPNYDREVVDGTRNNEAPFDKWVYKKIEAEEVLKDVLVKIDEKMRELDDELDAIDDEMAMVIRYRYILKECWDDIAKHMNYAVSTVYRLHAKGLEILKKTGDANEL